MPHALPLLLASPERPRQTPGTTHPISAPPLPGAGPAWFPSVMGTGILAGLLQTHAHTIPGAHFLAPATLIICWLLLLGLTLAFTLRCLTQPGVLRAALTLPAQIPFWGTVSMGILSAGSSTTLVLPAHLPGSDTLAWQIDTVTWTIGTIIGVLSALYFGTRLVGPNLGDPTPVWGLAVVGPMVSATTGALLAQHVPTQFAPYILMAALSCFFLALSLGLVIFAYAYQRHWRTAPIPLVASASSWIPLGLVGQSTAAVQAMAHTATPMTSPEFARALAHMANVYGYAMFFVGTPLIAWATLVTLRGFQHRMPFTPGWWALTFPIGTLALGATLLGRGTGYPAFTGCGVAATVILIGTVTLCLVASAHAVGRATLRPTHS